MQSYLKVLVLAGILTGAASVLAEDAVPQIFELKNGDRITATVQSQSETIMVVLTPFGGTLTLPMDQITKQSPLPSPEEIAAEAEKAAKAEAEKAATRSARQGSRRMPRRSLLAPHRAPPTRH